MARRPVKGAPSPATVSTVPEGSAPPTLPVADEPVVAPQRLLRAYSFIGGMFGRGRFEWKPGEVIHDPAEVAYLRERGVLMEPVAD